MADRFVDGQPGVRGVQHQVVLAWLDRPRLQLLPRLPGRRRGIFQHVVALAVHHHAGRQGGLVGRVAIEVFVAEAHRRGEAVAVAELAAGLVDHGHRQRRCDAVDVLVDVGAIAGGEVFLFVDGEHRRVDEIRAGLHRGGIHRQQQVHLFLDRNRHRVLADRCLPAGFAHPFDGCKSHWLAANPGVGLGQRGGLARGIGDCVAGQAAGGGKAPRAAGDHPHADAGGFGIDHAGHLVFAGGDELAQVAADAHIAVGGAGFPRRLQCYIRQTLLEWDIQRTEQGFGRHRMALQR